MKHTLKTLILLSLTLGLSACCGCTEPAQTSFAAPQGTECSTVSVTGMTCEACAASVTANLKKLKGVKDVAVDVSKGTVAIYTAPHTKLSSADIKKTVEYAGYTFNSVQAGCAQ